MMNSDAAMAKLRQNAMNQPPTNPVMNPYPNPTSAPAHVVEYPAVPNGLPPPIT